MICPTRGRPQNARQLWLAWQDAGTGLADLHFAIDDDDPWLDAYLATFNEMPGVNIAIRPRMRMVGTLNAAALELVDTYNYLGFLGDDHRPRTRGWDERFIAEMSGAQETFAWSCTSPVSAVRMPKTSIVYGNDLLQGEAMPTAVAMTSDIVRTLGYMAPPVMKHLCVDLVWKDWGLGIKRLTYLDDVIIEHMHPANGKAAMDTGYAEVNSIEMMTSDSAAYYVYRDDGGLADDLEKLETLL
jgi:hypothetical protein